MDRHLALNSLYESRFIPGAFWYFIVTINFIQVLGNHDQILAKLEHIHISEVTKETPLFIVLLSTPRLMYFGLPIATHTFCFWAAAALHQNLKTNPPWVEFVLKSHFEKML